MKEPTVALSATYPNRQSTAERLDTSLAQFDCIGATTIGFEFTARQTRDLLKRGKPIVAVGGHSGRLPSVTIDDIQAARLATNHLLALGHTNVAYLAGTTVSAFDFEMRANRVRGYSESMEAAGLRDESRIISSSFAFDDAFAAATRLLSGPERPTAVFATNDELALAVLASARRLKLRVPRDLSVIGVDDHPLAVIESLTTIHQDPKDSGQAAVGRILGLTGKDAQVMAVRIVTRASTGPPPGLGIGTALRHWLRSRLSHN